MISKPTKEKTKRITIDLPMSTLNSIMLTAMRENRSVKGQTEHIVIQSQKSK